VAGAHGDDPAKPPPAPAAPPPPSDPVKEQMFQDKAADDALALMQKGDITSVMEGLDRLSKARSGKDTSGVIDFVLTRTEKHVAEFAGFALSCSDPAGSLKEMAARLADPKTLRPDQLEQMAALLAEVPSAEADKLLANDRFLKSNDESVRRTAIQGLGWHRSTLAIETTIEALGSKEVQTREIACCALGRIGDPRAIDALVRHLDDKDGPGGFAAIALGRIENERIFKAVADSLQGGALLEKCKALVAVARPNPKHVAALLNMVKNAGNDVKIAACSALGKIKDQSLDTQKVLLDAMFGDTDRWVRVAAFHALGMCCTKELAPVIAKRLGQKDEEKLRYLYEICGDVGAKEVLPDLVEEMWTQKNDVLRCIAIDAFWRIHDGPAVAECEKKIRAATGKSFERAMDILALRKNRNGFDMAIELLGTPTYKGADQFQIELALEKQTGHFFGPDVQVWKDWIAKNAKFFEKEQAALERAKWREEFLKENKGAGVTPVTEECVQSALDYLARHQSPDGCFDQQNFMKLCAKPGCPNTAGARIQMDPAGVTSLCTLAYFGAGCGPSKGRYRGVLARAMEYLLSRQMANGDYDPNDLIGGYNRALVLQAYSEAAVASVESQEYLPFVQRGVDFLASIQADKAGWRYRVVDNSNDTSVVAWVLFACKAAAKAHAKVRPSIFEGCDIVMSKDQTRPRTDYEDFVPDVDPNYAFDVGRGHEHLEYWTGYQDSGFAKNKATTALGLMSRILLGYRRTHPFCIGSANAILSKQPLPMPKKAGDWATYQIDMWYPMYFIYYGTLSMHQMGGKYFTQWDKSLREILPNTQTKTGCARGSWESWSFDRDFSRLYTTALGALTLETYYRYAPVLQD
jgi:HEAT repeat protein